MSNPISAIQEFYQRLHVPPSSIQYSTTPYCLDRPEQPEQRFVCSVKLPRVVLEDSGVVREVLGEEIFQGEGRKKADAKRDAAATALAYLQEHPLYRQQQQAQAPLQEVLDACMANQGIMRDAELRAFWTYCQQHPLAHPHHHHHQQQQQQEQQEQEEPAAAAAAAAGQQSPRAVLLPLTALAHSKQLLQWLRQQHNKEQQQQEAPVGGPAAAAGFDDGDVPGLMRHIRQLLKRHAAAGKLLPGVSLVAGGLGLSRREVLHAAGGHRNTQHHAAATAAAALAHEVWEDQPLLVEVPADVRQPILEHALRGPPLDTAAESASSAPPLLQQLAGLLLLPHPFSIVCWGRVGPRSGCAATPAEWRNAEQQWQRIEQQAIEQQRQQQQQQQAKEQQQPQQQKGQQRLDSPPHGPDPTRLHRPVGGAVQGSAAANAGTGGSGSALLPAARAAFAGPAAAAAPGSSAVLDAGAAAAGAAGPAAGPVIDSSSIMLGGPTQVSAVGAHLQQQQQQDADLDGTASAGEAVQQPPLKRQHKAADSEQQQQQQDVSRQDAATPAASAGEMAAGGAAHCGVESAMTVLQAGGGAAAMDWEATEPEAPTSHEPTVQEQGKEQQQQQSALHSVLPPAPTSHGLAGSKHALPDSSSSGTSAHMLDVTPPFMYSAFHEDEQQQAAAGLNLRASWLAGRAVFGTVLLAGCGIARGRSTQHVVKWRSYSARSFWVGMAALFPARAHASRAAPAPTLMRLPHAYRCGNWLGDSPKQQLERYASRHHPWVKNLQTLKTLSPSSLTAAAADAPAGEEAAAAAAAAAGSAGPAASGVVGVVSNSTGETVEPVAWSLSVLDAAVPCSSPAGFNCSARLRVQPMAAAAAVAAGGSAAGLLGLDPAAAAALEVRCDTAAGPGSAVARLEIEEPSGQLVAVADSGPAMGPLEAQNCAALAALHLLQALDAAALTGCTPELPPPPMTAAQETAETAEAGASAMDVDTAVAAAEGALSEAVAAAVAAGGVEGGDNGGLYGVELLWPGQGGGLLQPKPGLLAKVDAHLYLPPWEAAAAAAREPPLAAANPNSSPSSPSSRDCYSLDLLRGCSFLLGCGAVVPQLEALLMQLEVGAAAQARVLLPYEGCDVLLKFKPQPALLAVHLLDVCQPKAATAAAASGQTASQTNVIFDPSLSLQRRRLVSQLVRQERAAVVVDVGCGEGSLLKHLLCDCGFTDLSRIVGVDVSSSALAAAARRLEGLSSQWLAVGEEAAAAAGAGATPSTAAAAGGTGGTGDAAAAGAAVAGEAGAAAGGGAADPGSSAEAAVPPPEASLSASEGQGSTLTGRLGSATARQAAAAAAAAAPAVSGPAGSEVRGGSFTQGHAAATLLRQLSISSTAAAPAAAPAAASTDQQLPQQHQQVVAQGGYAWTAQLQLLQADVTHPGLSFPEAWQALGLNPGCDLVACIEVIEHLQPQAVGALGRSVLGGLNPKTAVFTTPNWEYNTVLQQVLGPELVWLGPPGRDGKPLRHGDHKFEWTRAEFRAWAAKLAQQHGYSVEFADMGRAIREEEALKQLQQQQQPVAGSSGSGGGAAMPLAAHAAGGGDAAAAGVGVDADTVGEKLLAELPSVTASAPPEVAAAAAAVSAAMIAIEQQQQRHQQQVGMPGGSSAGEAVRQVEQGQQQEQPSIRPDSGFGGATQAAIFRRIKQPDDAAAGAVGVVGTTDGSSGGGGDSAAGVSAGGELQLLRVMWGPQMACMRVGDISNGPGQGVGAAVAEDVPVEHF